MAQDTCPYVILLFIGLALYCYNNGYEPFGGNESQPITTPSVTKQMNKEKVEYDFPDVLDGYKNQGKTGHFKSKPLSCSWDSGSKWATLEEGVKKCNKLPRCKGLQMFTDGRPQCLYENVNELDTERKNLLIRFTKPVKQESPLDSFTKLPLGNWQKGNGNAIAYKCADQNPPWESPHEAAARCLQDVSCDGFQMRPNGKGDCLYQNTHGVATEDSKYVRYGRISEAEICRAKGNEWVYTPSGEYKCKALKII